MSKQADREREREERKKKKLDKLRQEYHHEFADPEYYKARSEVTDKVHEALEQGKYLKKTQVLGLQPNFSFFF